MAQLKVGDSAPPFELLDQDDNTVKLSDLKGRKVLLYFYPRRSLRSGRRPTKNMRQMW